MADLVDGVADEVKGGSVADEIASRRAAGREDGVADGGEDCRTADCEDGVTDGVTTISADGPGSKVGSSPSPTSSRCSASVPSSGG